MAPERQRLAALAALVLGAAFSWVPPCLVAVAVGHTLPQAVFITWSLAVAVGCFLIAVRLIERWRP
jgi:hypothetical protein